MPAGKLTNFMRAVQAREDRTVVFSWIEFPSKDRCSAALEKMECGPRLKEMDMPFDGKRMIFGGFVPILDERARRARRVSRRSRAQATLPQDAASLAPPWDPGSGKFRRWIPAQVWAKVVQFFGEGRERRNCAWGVAR